MTSQAPNDLDQLLAAWAGARRLPEADAERILGAIVPAAPALPASEARPAAPTVRSSSRRVMAMVVSCLVLVDRSILAIRRRRGYRESREERAGNN